MLDLAVKARGSIVVVDFTLSFVYRLEPDLENGAILSSMAVGGGAPILRPRSIVVARSGEIFILDQAYNTILSIEPASGDRTTISGGGIGAGPPLVFPQAIALDEIGRLLVTDRNAGSLLRIDPVSGEREILTGQGVGTGPVMSRPSGIAVEPSGSILVADAAFDSILRIDPSTGHRSILSSSAVGSGPWLVAVEDIALTLDGLLASSNVTLSSLIRVDPVTGDRTIVSDRNTGSGLQQVFSFLAVAPDLPSPPDCSAARAAEAEILPPDGRFSDLSIVGVVDPDDDPVEIRITGIFQDEPTDVVGPGGRCPDGLGSGTAVASLRAERSGSGDGRVYRVVFEASDDTGRACTGIVSACVPHDRGSGHSCRDQGPLFDSTRCDQQPGRPDGPARRD
jgi:hypothetical protein